MQFLFGTTDRFRGRQFFHRLGWWWFRNDSSTLHFILHFISIINNRNIIYILLFYIHQLHLRSSGSRADGGLPAIRDKEEVIRYLSKIYFQCICINNFSGNDNNSWPMDLRWHIFLAWSPPTETDHSCCHL